MDEVDESEPLSSTVTVVLKLGTQEVHLVADGDPEEITDLAYSLWEAIRDAEGERRSYGFAILPCEVEREQPILDIGYPEGEDKG